MRKLGVVFGVGVVANFVTAFFLLGWLNPEFDFLGDYISKLGAMGQPYSAWWNVCGFGVTGVLFAAFGVTIGLSKKDPLLGGCLVVAGVSFGFGAVPTDFDKVKDSLSTIHFVSICFSLAGWCFGLARLGKFTSDRIERLAANVSAVLVVMSLIGAGIELISPPVSHRIILITIFVWILGMSFCFIRD